MSHFTAGFNISQRAYDGAYIVSDYAWWPDDYLDSNPEAQRRWLEGTRGWRAKGWIIVHVAKTFRDAKTWCYNMKDAR
jgi:hypothetical protein